MPSPSPELASEAPAPSLAERRTEQILHAAVALFAERGYVETKIEDISNAVGVGKGLIYRYFQDKQDVLFHALCAVLDKYRQEDFIGRLESSGPLATLRHALDVHCRIADRHTPETILAYRSTKDLGPEQRARIKALETDLVDQIQRCLQACIDRGLMQPANVQVMAYQLLMFGHTWALKRWSLGLAFDIDQYVADGERLLIDPFVTAAGRRELERLRAAAPARQRMRRAST